MNEEAKKGKDALQEEFNTLLNENQDLHQCKEEQKKTIDEAMVNLREEAKKIQDQRDLHKNQMEELNQKQ